MLQKVNIPILDCDDNQGWIWREGNIIEPLWTKVTILPQPVVGFLDLDLNNELAKNDERTDFE